MKITKNKLRQIIREEVSRIRRRRTRQFVRKTISSRPSRKIFSLNEELEQPFYPGDLVRLDDYAHAADKEWLEDHPGDWDASYYAAALNQVGQVIAVDEVDAGVEEETRVRVRWPDGTERDHTAGDLRLARGNPSGP